MCHVSYDVQHGETGTREQCAACVCAQDRLQILTSALVTATDWRITLMFWWVVKAEYPEETHAVPQRDLKPGPSLLWGNGANNCTAMLPLYKTWSEKRCKSTTTLKPAFFLLASRRWLHWSRIEVRLCCCSSTSAGPDLFGSTRHCRSFTFPPQLGFLLQGVS